MSWSTVQRLIFLFVLMEGLGIAAAAGGRFSLPRSNPDTDDTLCHGCFRLAFVPIVLVRKGGVHALRALRLLFCLRRMAWREASSTPACSQRSHASDKPNLAMDAESSSSWFNWSAQLEPCHRKRLSSGFVTAVFAECDAIFFLWAARQNCMVLSTRAVMQGQKQLQLEPLKKASHNHACVPVATKHVKENTAAS